MRKTDSGDIVKTKPLHLVISGQTVKIFLIVRITHHLAVIMKKAKDVSLLPVNAVYTRSYHFGTAGNQTTMAAKRLFIIEGKTLLFFAHCRQTLIK